LIRHFLPRGIGSSQALTLPVGLLTLAMSPSAFARVLVTAVGLIGLIPPVVIPTHLATANLPTVAVDTEVEDLATGGVLTDTPTNKQNQGGKPLWGNAVDKGRRLWEALNPTQVELPFRGPSPAETPIGNDDRGFSLPLKAKQFNRDKPARAFTE
jgi:hypothetical protein